jgi:hypothetical protein
MTTVVGNATFAVFNRVVVSLAQLFLQLLPTPAAQWGVQRSLPSSERPKEISAKKCFV